MNKITLFLDRYLVVRYIISGGVASGIDILLFIIFIEVFNLHYIISVSISITISFIVRFYLQKVFAFKDKNIDIYRQLSMYTILYLLSITITTLLLYVFIDIFHLWYVLAQIVSIFIVAILSFFIYKYVIFKKSNSDII